MQRHAHTSHHHPPDEARTPGYTGWLDGCQTQGKGGVLSLAASLAGLLEGQGITLPGVHPPGQRRSMLTIPHSSTRPPQSAGSRNQVPRHILKILHLSGTFQLNPRHGVVELPKACKSLYKKYVQHKDIYATVMHNLLPKYGSKAQIQFVEACLGQRI